MLNDVFKEFQALPTVSDKIRFLENLEKHGGFYGYDVNVPALVKAWSKYL